MHRFERAGWFGRSLGWLGGGFAPIVIALAAAKYGMGPSISGTAAVYLVSGLLMLLAARQTILASSKRPKASA